MNDLRDHLLDTSRPPAPHLVNGADEWKKLDSLAVERATWRGEVLVLILSAHNPVAARPVQVPQDVGTESSQMV